jgi:predicted transcriptional regulator
MPARKVTTQPDRLTVTLEAAERAELDRLSERTERSLAWHVREALRQYLPRAQELSVKEKKD